MHAIAEWYGLKQVVLQGLYRRVACGRRNVEPEIPKKVSVTCEPGGIGIVLPIEKSVVVGASAGQDEMLPVPVERGQVVGIGIGTAREWRNASVVALASDIRIVIKRPAAIVDVQ